MELRATLKEKKRIVIKVEPPLSPMQKPVTSIWKNWRNLSVYCSISETAEKR